MDSRERGQVVAGEAEATKLLTSHLQLWMGQHGS